MTIKRVVTAIALTSLMGIILPVANAQAPPCFTFDGQIQTMQCPLSFRPAPVAYYSGVQQGDYVQATDDNDEELPNAFFDQQTINTLRENAAQTQNQSTTQEQEPTDEQILAQQQQLFKEQQEQPQAEPQPTSGPEPGQFQAPRAQPQPTTINATAAGANQTAPATNLTSSDIEAVRDSLNAARQSLQNNNNQAAIDSINRADGALFAIILDEGKGPLSEALTTLSDDIEITRASTRNLDNEKATADLNAADSQLVLITEMLPTEEPPARADENQTLDTGIFPEQQQFPGNQSETIPPMPEPAPTIQPPAEAEEPTIKIPLNKSQQELVTIEEIAGINKTTHEKTTISIIEGNKTTHREITTTEVPL